MIKNKSHLDNEIKFNYFFIHNYKTLGTTIYSQLPKEYNDLYYGFRNLKDVEIKNPNIILNPNYDKKKKNSLDHHHVDKMIDMGFLKKDLSKIKFMMIVRDPIDRFLSICNFHKISPENLIYKLKNKIDDNFYQNKFIKSKHNLDIIIFKMNNKKGIINFFKNYNININLDKKMNVSIKKYSINKNKI